MIPLFATLRIRHQKPGDARRHGFRLWLPLFLIWLLLAPLVLILMPIFFAVCFASRINPFRSIAAIWRFLSALRGTHIEVDTAYDTVLVHIY